MIRMSLGIATLLLGGPVLAEDFSYNYIQLSYQHVEIEEVVPDVDLEGDGFELGGSVELGESWFLAVDYSQASLDFGIDLDQIAVGVGYHAAMSQSVDVYAALSFVQVGASASGGGSEDENGYAVTVGVRGALTEHIELEADLSYIDLGDGEDGAAYGIGGTYAFTERFALNLNIEFEEDATGYGVGARYYFGK